MGLSNDLSTVTETFQATVSGVSCATFLSSFSSSAFTAAYTTVATSAGIADVTASSVSVNVTCSSSSSVSGSRVLVEAAVLTFVVTLRSTPTAVSLVRC
jgi:hypothetical protein